MNPPLAALLGSFATWCAVKRSWIYDASTQQSQHLRDLVAGTSALARSQPMSALHHHEGDALQDICTWHYRREPSDALLACTAPDDDDAVVPAEISLRLVDDARSGKRTLAVNSPVNVAVGQSIRLNPGGWNEEDHVVSGLRPVVLEQRLRYAHESGEPVVPLLGLADVATQRSGDSFHTLLDATHRFKLLFMDASTYLMHTSGFRNFDDDASESSEAEPGAAHDSLLMSWSRDLSAFVESTWRRLPVRVRFLADGFVELIVSGQHWMRNMASAVVARFLDQYPEHQPSLNRRDPLLVLAVFVLLVPLLLWETTRLSQGLFVLGGRSARFFLGLLRHLCRMLRGSCTQAPVPREADRFIVGSVVEICEVPYKGRRGVVVGHDDDRDPIVKLYEGKTQSFTRRELRLVSDGRHGLPEKRASEGVARAAQN
eukprot:TRINITY_DN14189_c2_g3_i1.p1 TRINITY_DN14189_c2_g3~~TRINITY_DN14189_c2_g3_i1.p1  ORF type:complete len:429 (+),score=57.10 TRINITY_DN14189_c2_g3_i1:142-1428(+)